MTLKALVCVLLVMGLAACKSERVQGPKNNVQKVLSDFVFSQAGDILGRVQNRFVVDRNGFPIAQIVESNEGFLIKDSNESPFCKVQRSKDSMIISDEKSAIFRVSESAKGIELFRLPNNKAEVTFVNTNARSCRLQNTPYRSEASASGHDVLRGQSMLYSTENLGCFTSLALSLAAVPFVERFCIVGAIEML